MDKKERCSILVNSCDKYEVAWEPFFRLLKIQWPDCPYKFYLVTEEKDFECSHFPVQTIKCGSGLPWGGVIKHALTYIKSEYIIYLLEDEFIRSPVHAEALENMIDWMNENRDIGCVILKHSPFQKMDIAEPYFDRNLIIENGYYIVGISTLYRKEYFEKILRSHESPWEYELYASMRSRRYPERVFQYNKSEPVIFDYDDSPVSGWGFTHGKWIRGTKELFDQYGIEVDFEKLGWYEPTYSDYEKYAKTKGISLEQVLPKELEKQEKMRGRDEIEKTIGFSERFHDIMRFCQKMISLLRNRYHRYLSLR